MQLLTPAFHTNEVVLFLRYGMEVVDINGGTSSMLATDNRVVAPLDFDEVGNLLTPISTSDL